MRYAQRHRVPPKPPWYNKVSRGTCRACGKLLAGYAAIAADRLAPKVLSGAPKPERSCETCLNTRSSPGSACDRCDDFSEWTDG